VLAGDFAESLPRGLELWLEIQEMAQSKVWRVRGERERDHSHFVLQQELLSM